MLDSSIDRMPPSSRSAAYGSAAALRHDLARALEDRSREQLAARGGLLQAEPGERRQVIGAQHGDDDDDQRGDAGDLLGLD